MLDSCEIHLYYRDALLAFKHMNNCAPDYLSSQFRTRREVSCRETRNGHKLDVPLFKSAAGQKNVSLQNHHSLE